VRTLHRRTPSGHDRAGALAATLALALLSLSGCVNIRPRTEVIVDVVADPSISGATEALLVVVRGGPGEEMLEASFDDTVLDPSFPLRITVLPRDEDASRIFEVSVEAVGAGGELIGRQQARGRFLAGRTSYIRLVFEACCRSVARTCGRDETCVSCECTGIVVVEPTEDGGVSDAAFADDAASDAPTRDAGSDAGPIVCHPAG